ncbi:MAG TPA: L,D-transpeptidase family protein [Methylomusa anaerophila]|uniref:Putative L,D-transpeptidase YkuD n=1 Tax=Methylomusa anaerophila TaxID=1930071 RepID=A0A348ALK4_9FIRM|nr:L,D-transpeptidase family protein [Methylomusa anaerophila]BBB91952.1 putative L,D-transpeptidase YkuD [Methylomusa anaerophila]HML88036.1 L,D-transpeptidase family protein [Methylomusa anaerophila]
MARFWRIIIKPRSYFAIVSLLIITLFIGILSLDYWDELELAAIPDQPSAAPTGSISIVIKIPARILELHSDGKLYKKYRIAVGKSSTPTPIGDWTVIWKSYRSGDIMGTRILALNIPWGGGGYGIHGTSQPWSIGQFISHGCIRLRNKDIEELYEWVPVGTPVRIEDQRAYIRRALKYGITGADVVQLQRKLRDLGYLESGADGFFSRETETALKRFQHDKGLNPTGIADRKTLDLLGL